MKRKQKIEKECKPQKLNKSSKHKKICIICSTTVVALVVAGVTVFFVWRGLFGNTTENERSMNMGNFYMGNMASASGVTSVGMDSDDFEVVDLTTKLNIEEVYVTNNSEIETGTKICKIEEDSITEAREELEKALNDADLAYRAGAIQYEQSKITAKYDYDSAVLSGKQAKAVYEETLNSLNESEAEALEELTDAQEKIAEYENALANDTYAEEYPYEKLKALYEENYKILRKRSTIECLFYFRDPCDNNSKY